MKAGTVLTSALIAAAGLSYAAIAHEEAVRKSSAKQVASEALPNVPGKRLTAVVVHYGPGERSAGHRHAGSVWAYVLDGSIRSENSATGPVRIYQKGESFFEPPGSVHLVSENGSDTAPAELLAVFVADENAVLTIPEKK